MATAPSTNDLTRQQLDELDNLLQRMLALPLTPPDTASGQTIESPPLPGPVPATTWRLDPPSVVPTPTPHLKQNAPVTEAPRPRSAIQMVTEMEAAPSPKAPPVQVNRPELEVKNPDPIERPEKVVTKSTPREISPSATISPTKVTAGTREQPQLAIFEEMALPFANEVTQLPPPPVPFFLEPFVLINRIFDSICGIFGLPGRLIRTGFTKTTLGLTGFMLTLYTCLHVATLKGWMILPFNIPWPR